MFRPLLLLPLAVSLLGQQHRGVAPFFDASYRCMPGPRPTDCVIPEEHMEISRPVRSAPPVSLYRLSHKVPGKAKKAWRRAAAAASDGRSNESLAFLDEALTHDGDFADALHMRGLFAFQDKDFRRAATLDDANAAFLADAALSQLVVRNPVEAERYARAALRLNPEQSRALQVLNRLRP